ncbi:hypothetical protein V5O48_000192 [Marasmius crinis-equi]|uniref:Uncharacterized protein n=1 Tax=Marasmius crinis-equi TaxID=585013 RepID=A0ABR3G2C9_9AGAR
MPDGRLYPNPFGHEHFGAIYMSGRPVTAIPIAYRFAKTAASKGYFATVFGRFMTFIARFVTPSNGAKMASELLDAAIQYERGEGRLVMDSGAWAEASQERADKRVESLRSTVERACYLAGWFGELEKIRAESSVISPRHVETPTDTQDTARRIY